MPIQDKLPRSRITLVYRTTISGQEQEVNLPFRVLVLGDFSLGTSEDRRTKDLEQRQLRSVTGSNLNELMQDMKMSMPQFTVTNELNAAKDDDTIPVDLNIKTMKSFNPDDIVTQVPQLKALMLMRKLLLEIQSDIDNRKELRTQIYELYKNKADLDAMRADADIKKYETLKLPESKSKNALARAADPKALPAGQ